MKAEDKMERINNEKFFSMSNDNDEDEWVPPDADLIQKMVSQIEYYLSDENLSKDAFLLKHIRRNKMGYVNIKLLTSFKKMKHLTRDWRVTAYALRHSLKLEVNEEGNKVRRLEQVPESVLFQVPSKLLLIWNIKDSNQIKDTAPCKSTLEAAIAILEPFGTITMARVNRPGRELPPELQKYSYRYPELFTNESVLVEFEDLEGAGRAYHQLSQSEDEVNVLLVGKASKKKAAELSSEDRNNGKGISLLNQRMLQLQACGDDSSACSSSESEFASPLPYLNNPRFSSTQVGGSPLSSPRSSPRCACSSLPGCRISPLLASEVWGSPDTSPELRRRNPDPSISHQQRRKLFANQRCQLEGIYKHSQTIEKRAKNGDMTPPGVLRLPFGPDGSKGFHSTLARRQFHPSCKV